MITVILVPFKLASQDLDEPVSFKSLKGCFREKAQLLLPAENIYVPAYAVGIGKNRPDKIISLPDYELNYEGSNQQDYLYELTVPPSQQYLLNFQSGTRLVGNCSSIIILGFADRRWKNFEVKGEAYIQQGADDDCLDITAGKVKVCANYAYLNVSNYDDDPFLIISLEKGSILIKYDSSFIRLDQPGTELWIEKKTGYMWIDKVPVSDIRNWVYGLVKPKEKDPYCALRQIARWYNISFQYPNRDIGFDSSRTIKYRTNSIDNVIESLNSLNPKVRFYRNGNTAQARFIQ
jgi:hypothetical protein